MSYAHYGQEYGFICVLLGCNRNQVESHSEAAFLLLRLGFLALWISLFFAAASSRTLLSKLAIITAGHLNTTAARNYCYYCCKQHKTCSVASCTHRDAACVIRAHNTPACMKCMTAYTQRVHREGLCNKALGIRASLLFFFGLVLVVKGFALYRCASGRT